MTEQEINDIIENKLFYTTKDPQGPMSSWPALTTLLHKVCGGDHTLFINEGCRVAKLFMIEAFKEGMKHGSNTNGETKES